MKSVYLLSIIILIFSSCSSEKDKFEGVWYNTKNMNDLFSIQKNEKSFIFEQNGKKFPAIIKEGLLEVSSKSPIKASIVGDSSLIIMGNEYKRFNSDRFLGMWKLDRNNLLEFLTITKDKNNYKVVYKSESDLFVEHPIELRYSKGELIGSYYGESDNVRIKFYGLDIISFSINPFAEFTPINNSFFVPTLSTFILKNKGNFFVGTWKSDANKNQYLKVKPYSDFYQMDIGDEFSNGDINNLSYNSFAVFEENVLLSSDINRSIELIPIDEKTIIVNWKKENLAQVTYKRIK